MKEALAFAEKVEATVPSTRSLPFEQMRNSFAQLGGDIARLAGSSGMTPVELSNAIDEMVGTASPEPTDYQFFSTLTYNQSPVPAFASSGNYTVSVNAMDLVRDRDTVLLYSLSSDIPRSVVRRQVMELTLSAQLHNIPPDRFIRLTPQVIAAALMDILMDDET